MASVAFQDTLVVQRGSFGGPPRPIFKQSWVCVVCVVCPLECVLALVYSILQTIPKNPKHLQYQKKSQSPKKIQKQHKSNPQWQCACAYLDV